MKEIVKRATPSTTRMDERSFDPAIFEPMSTKSILDEFWSNAKGVPKATNWMITGDPGVGKTTVMLDIISTLKKFGYKVLFVSAEMNEIDLKLYVDRYPKFGAIDIWFPQESNCATQDLENLLNEGYDIVLIDSFVELQDIIREELEIGAKASENWLIDLLGKHNQAQNKTKTYTTGLFIQQVTKGGVFVGTNKLKHMTTGFMHIQFEDPENDESERYLMFSKNRRGNVLKKLYFNLHTTGDVAFDEERYHKAKEIEQSLKIQKDAIKNSGTNFDSLFGTGKAKKEDKPENAIQEAEVLETNPLS